MYSFAHSEVASRFHFRFPFAKNRLSDTSGPEMTFRARNGDEKPGVKYFFEAAARVYET